MRDKQITEIANDLNMHCCSLAEQFCGEMSCNACISNWLYYAGYRKSTDLAREIFEEMLNERDKAIDFTADSRRIRFELCQQKDIDPYKDRFFNVFDGKYNCVLGFGKYIAELKKKYESEDFIPAPPHTCQVEIPKYYESITDIAFQESEDTE